MNTDTAETAGTTETFREFKPGDRVFVYPVHPSGLTGVGSITKVVWSGGRDTFLTWYVVTLDRGKSAVCRGDWLGSTLTQEIVDVC